MTYHDDDLLAISALQHYLFCPRQCALIHLEQVWAENHLTMEGLLMHERADSPTHETRPREDGSQVRVERALPIRSLQLGLIGKADIVEFHHSAESANITRIIPVEYKRGKPKSNDCDRVQLCAQALCLEEMCATETTAVSIQQGALFYGTKRRRTEVAFDDDLRGRTLQTIDALRKMIDGRVTPAAIRTKACGKCSLIDLCLPDATNGDRSVARFMNRQLAAACAEAGVSISLMSPHGRFRAAVVGFSPGNVLLRRQQYRAADDPDTTARIAFPARLRTAAAFCFAELGMRSRRIDQAA